MMRTPSPAHSPKTVPRLSRSPMRAHGSPPPPVTGLRTSLTGSGRWTPGTPTGTTLSRQQSSTDVTRHISDDAPRPHISDLPLSVALSGGVHPGNSYPARTSSSQTPPRLSPAARAATQITTDSQTAPMLPAPAPTLLQSMHSDSNRKDTMFFEIGGKVKIGAIAEGSVTVIRAMSIYEVIDSDSRGSVSKLDLLKAIQKCKDINEFLLPGVDCSNASRNEQAFEAVNGVFNNISGGKKRISGQEFVEFFRQKEQDEEIAPVGISMRSSSDPTGLSDDLRIRLHTAFNVMDTNSDGIVSKLDLVTSVRHHSSVASLILPGVDHVHIMKSPCVFDAVDEVFDKISKGKKRIDFNNFVEHFCRKTPVQLPLKVPILQRIPRGLQRSSYRVLIISPGFGREINPRQAALVTQSGFQIQWSNVPNPEGRGFDMNRHLSTVKSDIDRYRPDLLVSASKGGHYVRSLWNLGLWRGATLMLNAEPSLKELPKGAPIVIAHGGCDELYTRSREDLEQLVSTGSPNMCLLYTSVTSGKVKNGVSRRGDMHNMESLLTLDCLPRLMDAALSSLPEMQMMQSWRSMLGDDRLRAEEWLGCSPDDLKRFWQSADRRGMDSKKLFEVPRGSEEFQRVSAVFRSEPKQPAYYSYVATPEQKAQWSHTGIIKIQRVENGPQESGSAQPYYESLKRSIEDQGLAFEPGLHTRWAFHGTPAVESIISNPIAGFQPLTSGARVGTLWGTGTYFARDAKYVCDAGFANADAGGTRTMLMCLLSAGMSCIGDPQQSGVLPFRQKPHRYNSSVDSLSSPEVFIMQHPSSSYPAYVITFR